MLRCVLHCADSHVPRTATNPEYFADDKSSSKPPRNAYYNNSPAGGVSRTGSRYNESRVWRHLLTYHWTCCDSVAVSVDLDWTMVIPTVTSWLPVIITDVIVVITVSIFSCLSAVYGICLDALLHVYDVKFCCTLRCRQDCCQRAAASMLLPASCCPRAAACCKVLSLMPCALGTVLSKHNYVTFALFLSVIAIHSAIFFTFIGTYVTVLSLFSACKICIVNMQMSLVLFYY